MLTAVGPALTGGVFTGTHVLNLLHRLVDGKVIGGPPPDTPQALPLTHRYHILGTGNDSLRFKANSAAAARKGKKTHPSLIPA